MKAENYWQKHRKHRGAFHDALGTTTSAAGTQCWKKGQHKHTTTAVRAASSLLVAVECGQVNLETTQCSQCFLLKQQDLHFYFPLPLPEPTPWELGGISNIQKEKETWSCWVKGVGEFKAPAQTPVRPFPPSPCPFSLDQHSCSVAEKPSQLQEHGLKPTQPCETQRTCSLIS